MSVIGWLGKLVTAPVFPKKEPVSATVTTPFVPPLIKQNWPLQKDCNTFYGNPYNGSWYAANMTMVACPWKLDYQGNPVQAISIHKKCADSLSRVLGYVWVNCDKSQANIDKLKYNKFSGSYNLRPMRGSSQPSMHGYGCAIDFDDADNQFHESKHLFTGDSLLVKAFKAEGWEWGGDWSPASVDAMHFQAAHVR